MRFQSPYVSLSFASYSYDFHVIFQRNVCKSDIYIYIYSLIRLISKKSKEIYFVEIR